MLRIQRQLDDLFLLVGQVARNALLRAARHERLDPSPKLGEQLCVLAALDRRTVLLLEPARAGEQPRGSDRQQGPQLHQVVLHRRARDRQFEGRRQLLCALVPAGLVIRVAAQSPAGVALDQHHRRDRSALAPTVRAVAQHCCLHRWPRQAAMQARGPPCACSSPGRGRYRCPGRRPVCRRPTSRRRRSPSRACGRRRVPGRRFARRPRGSAG